jgi:outer membrane protein TolC
MHSLQSVRKGILVFCLLAALQPLRAGAGEPTLPDTVQAAFQRSPRLELSDAMRHSGQAIRSQASSPLAGAPSLLLRHESDAVTEDDGYREWEAGVEMPIWLPGQRDRRGKVADAVAGEAEALSKLQLWRVAGEVRELLWSLFIAESEQALARQAFESAKTLENDIAKRVTAGELARTELILAQKETLAREMAMMAADADYAALLGHYRLVTGLSVLPRHIEELEANLTAVTDGHPALVAARFATDRTRAERDQVRGEKYENPLLYLGSKTERPESRDSYQTALVVQINVPLGTSGDAAPNTAKAELRLSEAVSELSSVHRELENDLIEATSEKHRASQAVELSKRRRQLAEEGLRLTRRSFELGETDVFTLLQARAQALQSEHDLRISRLERGRAIARYNQALGVVPE